MNCAWPPIQTSGSMSSGTHFCGHGSAMHSSGTVWIFTLGRNYLCADFCSKRAMSRDSQTNEDKQSGRACCITVTVHSGHICNCSVSHWTSLIISSGLLVRCSGLAKNRGPTNLVTCSASSLPHFSGLPTSLLCVESTTSHSSSQGQKSSKAIEYLNC